MSISEPTNFPQTDWQMNRRMLLVGGSLAAAGLIVNSTLRSMHSGRHPVFVARGQRYDGPLTQTIRDGFIATGLDVGNLRGKRVLLKPNLVEPTRAAPHVTTHPAMIIAAAEVFRGLGAEVVVGEGPGHLRDTDTVLAESGVDEALQAAQLEFVDLNYDDVAWTPNLGRTSHLPGFWFPRQALDADLIVSLPKMKTHHWMGATIAMKNMFGVIPGVKYGWPKNVLHHAGIAETVFDINASLPKTISIVDGIDCMEGDGPIMGTLKHMGLVVVGLNLPAVDATVCRLMQLEPNRIGYLKLASNRLGTIGEREILQRGEDWRPLAQKFELVDAAHLKGLRRS